MTSRERVLDAAIELLGTSGLRSLSHNRVDDAARLPRGSASNHFRTRAALLSGAVDRIVEREMSAVQPVSELATSDDLVDRLEALLDVTTTENRTLTTARLVLFLESSHDATLREALDRGRSVMESSTASALERLGAPDPGVGAQAVMACMEGLLLHRIARHDDSPARDAIAVVVRAVLRG